MGTRVKGAGDHAIDIEMVEPRLAEPACVRIDENTKVCAIARSQNGSQPHGCFASKSPQRTLGFVVSCRFNRELNRNSVARSMVAMTVGCKAFARAGGKIPTERDTTQR